VSSPVSATLTARRLAGALDPARADLHAAVDLSAQLADEASEGRALA